MKEEKERKEREREESKGFIESSSNQSKTNKRCKMRERRTERDEGPNDRVQHCY